MKVAAVSNRNIPGYPDRNLADHLAWIDKAARRGVRLVLFPELSLSGYSTAPFMRQGGMTLASRPCRALVKAAREHDLYVAFGLPLKRGGKLYISHVLAGPGGVVGHYEKVHLAGNFDPPSGEPAVFSPGARFKVFDVDSVKVGIQICFDGRHPAASVCLAHLGAQIILHPHGNTAGHLGRDPREWTAKKRAYLGARAADTCTVSLICNSVGNVRDRAGRPVTYGGGALVLGPEGRYLARSTSPALRPHMVVADIDVVALRRRQQTAWFRQRRSDAYIAALSK